MRVTLPLLLIAACSGPPPPPAEAPDLRPGAETLRLVAVGDVGVGNASQRLVARAMQEVCASRGCDLGLLLGDNLYPRGLESPTDRTLDRIIDEVYAELDLPLYAVLGNHDYAHGRDSQRAEWQVQWATERSERMVLPARYYRFEAGPAQLLALDTTWVFWRGAEGQREWLRQALQSSDAQWQVVFGHHPLRSNGQHGNAGEYEGLPMVPYASGRAVESLLREEVCGQADLYLSGHEHNRQWIAHCGTELIVSGAGAKATELVDRGNTPRFAVAEEGFVWIELAPSGLTGAFYDERGSLEFEDRIPR